MGFLKKINSITFKIFILINIFYCNFLEAQPIPTTTDSRIKTLVYNPNEVFELRFYYGYQSFIEFADSEEIEMISIGESFSWRITPAGKRLFIRPLEVSAHTNMTVITNKRTYHFDIKSGEYSGKEDEELVYTVRFYYPQINQPLPIPPQLAISSSPKISKTTIRKPTPAGRIDENEKKSNILAISGNSDGLDLNFDYSVAGKSDNIMPLKVYDNGRETLMQFPNDNINVPTINAVDLFGEEHQLNYTIRDNYVVIPTVEKQLTLRSADSLLCIYNNNLIAK